MRRDRPTDNNEDGTRIFIKAGQNTHGIEGGARRKARRANADVVGRPGGGGGDCVLRRTHIADSSIGWASARGKLRESTDGRSVAVVLS